MKKIKTYMAVSIFGINSVAAFGRVRWAAILVLFVSVLLPKMSQGQQKEKVIEMTVLPGLQFSLPRFHVYPGQQVKIKFTNTDDMDHNLLILKPGKREDVVRKATEMTAKGLKNQYVPPGGDVLWHTAVLHHADSELLTFRAPKEEGIYPYVCTLPGHGFVMYGAMYINASGEMPPIEKDNHISPTRKKPEEGHVHHQSHPYPLKPPYLYRLYIEGAGPAAIAVHLPHKLSYCWDAGACRFRFAWKGDFVDNTDLWKGHKDARAVILGDIFYRETKEAVISIGNAGSESKPHFKGYKIVDGGYPEFHYTINGISVFELIKESKDGKGLVRSFRIPQLKDKVRFDFTHTDAVHYYFNGQELSADHLELGVNEGKQFTVEARIIK